MDENNIIDAVFEDVAGADQTDPPILEPELEQPSPAPTTNEDSTFLDKIADFIGTWAAAIILTFIAACGLGFCLTMVPAINFSFPLVLKCWAGIWSLMLIKGALANKVM